MTLAISQPWALYNEFDEHAANWLENLIARGLIAPGIVDRRSILDVRADDLRGFRQVHFFAGVGVWSYALRCSGVSDDTALWTGSPPCQPFSAAGQRGGVDDERHLWPALFDLIRQRRPERFFGEQVASKDGLGWLDLVLTDMEKAGYAIAALDTCSAGSGAPHIRQRLRIAAYDLGSAAGGVDDSFGNRWGARGRDHAQHDRIVPDPAGTLVGLADSSGSGSLSGSLSGIHSSEEGSGSRDGEPERSGDAFGLDDSLSTGLEGLWHGHSAETGQREGSLRPVASAGGIEWVADDPESGRQSWGWDSGSSDGRGSARLQPRRLCDAYSTPNRPNPTNGLWGDADWLFCRDGKWRPVEPGTFPLVDGAAFRVGSGSAFEGRSRQGMLKGYGNAIDAEATIDFIEAVLAHGRVEIDHEVGTDNHPGLEELGFEDLLG